MKAARSLLTTLGLVVAGSTFGVLALLAMSPISTPRHSAALPTARVVTPVVHASPSLVATPAGAPSSTPTKSPQETPSPRPTVPPTIMPTIATALESATPDHADSAAHKAEMLMLINQLRVQHGCQPLRAEPQLEQIAQAHADDMRDTERIDHVGSDGATYQNRLDRAGYPYQLYGENIAAYPASARDVMQGWTEGDENPDGPHRQNILNCLYTEAGIGLAFGANGVLYWSLDLANRRP